MKQGSGVLFTMAIAIGFLVGGAVVWTAGLVAVAQYTEDLCFDDLETRSEYGSYHSESTLWLPSFQCRLAGPDVAPIAVQHRSVALARFGISVAFPIVYALVATFTITSLSRSRRTSTDPGGSVLQETVDDPDHSVR